jgi:hypothetical protein
MDIPEDNDIPENQMKNAIQQAPGVDTEKQDAVHQDEDNNTALPSMPASAITIDPAIERRVLRKLDLRVPTLLGFLCESSPRLVDSKCCFLTRTLSLDLLGLLDRSNIGLFYDWSGKRFPSDYVQVMHT